MNDRPIVIAHRGASGYLPEHSLPGKALAYAFGADYLEQDVVASRDDELIVLHDIYLDRVSNVAQKFPTRARPDGRFYVRDFDMAELRSLSMWERFTADGSAVYPNRFPVGEGSFRVHTLREELRFLRDINTSTGGGVGCYAEIKRPAWHRQQGVDIAPELLRILAEFGYSTQNDAAFVQCFSEEELVRIRVELECELRLVQLIDDENLPSAHGLARLSATVDVIGPSLSQLYQLRQGEVEPTSLAHDAQRFGLHVHPYTFRRDEIPSGFSDFDALLEYFVAELKVDGLFTDFVDIVCRKLDQQC